VNDRRGKRRGKKARKWIKKDYFGLVKSLKIVIKERYTEVSEACGVKPVGVRVSSRALMKGSEFFSGPFVF